MIGDENVDLSNKQKTPRQSIYKAMQSKDTSFSEELPFHRINERLETRRETFEGGSHGLNDLLNTSAVSVSGRKSNSRRLTADAADLENLWSELNESTASVNSVKSKKSTKQKKMSKSITMDDSESIMGSTFNLSVSTDVGKKLATPSARRMTADVSDIAALIDNLDETETSEELPFSANSRQRKSMESVDFISPVSDTRRQTINASAIDDIVNSLDSISNGSGKKESTSRRSSISSLGDFVSMSNSRRQTVDASALDAVMNHLNDSSLSFDAVNPMHDQDEGLNESRNSRRDTVNASALDAIMNHLDETTETFDESNPLVKKNLSSHKIMKSRRSSLRSDSSMNLSSLSSVSSSRRRTADPQDMELMLKELADDDDVSKSSSKSRSRRSSLRSRRSSSKYDDRRVTADPADMAAMLDGIYDDGEEFTVNGSISDQNMMTGRESVDTIQLLQSVNKILHETSPRQSKDMSEISDLIDLNDSVHIDGNDDDQKSKIDLSTDTVNTMDLMTNIKHTLGDMYQSTMVDDTHDSYTFINRLEEKIEDSSDDIMKPLAPSSTLKSILSSKKPRRQSNVVPTSARKSVVFGSPAAAEFNKTSPTTNFTPLDKEQAKAYFPKHFSMDRNDMVEEEEPEDEITAENSEILDQWDRLTNASGGSDEELYPIEEGESNADNYGSPISINSSLAGKKRVMVDSNSSKRSRRRKSTLISPGKSPLLYEENAVDENEANLSPIDAAESSFTAPLPGNLMELMAQADIQNMEVDANTSNTEDKTQELEGNLQTLMRHIDYGHHSIVYDSDVSVASDKASSSSDNNSRNTSHSSQSRSLLSAAGLSFENITKKYGGNISVDSDLSNDASTVSDASYVSRASNQSRNNMAEYEEPSATVELENKLGDILEKSALEEVSYSDEMRQQSTISDFGHTEELEGNLAEMVDHVDQALSPVSSQQVDQDFGVSSMDIQVESSQENEDFANATVVNNNEAQSFSKELPKATTELREKLKFLNDNARRNTLVNCSQTPLPSQRSKSRLSVGFNQRKSILPNTIELIESIPKDLMVLEESIANETISFADLLANVSLLMTNDMHLPKGPSLGHIIEDSTRYFDANSDTQHLLADIISAATIEAGNHLQATYSDSSINQAWEGFIKSAEYSLEDIEDMLALLRPQVEELVNFNWNLWESRLCDVASESIKLEVESLRQKVADLRKENDALEHTLLSDLSMVQPHEVSMQVIESNNEEEILEIAKLEELEKMERSICDMNYAINLANSITYCQVKGMSKDSTIASINVDIKQADQVTLEDSLASIYFANVMVDDAEIGPLSSNALNIVDKVADIPNLLRKISGSVFMFKKTLGWMKSHAGSWGISESRIILRDLNGSQVLTTFRQVMAHL